MIRQARTYMMAMNGTTLSVTDAIRLMPPMITDTDDESENDTNEKS